jgi:hypothetical protein
MSDLKEIGIVIDGQTQKELATLFRQDLGVFMPDSPFSPGAQAVDVTAILDDLAAKNPEKLDWRKSIVDLMKLVGIDSSLAARKQLAAELQYSGDEKDSAAMNVWLHKEVIKKIAENGGKVPQELLS